MKRKKLILNKKTIVALNAKNMVRIIGGEAEEIATLITCNNCQVTTVSDENIVTMITCNNCNTTVQDNDDNG